MINSGIPIQTTQFLLLTRFLVHVKRRSCPDMTDTLLPLVSLVLPATALRDPCYYMDKLLTVIVPVNTALNDRGQCRVKKQTKHTHIQTKPISIAIFKFYTYLFLYLDTIKTSDKYFSG